jgi:dihydrofolate synthase/folylpolyglutamate synthase
MERQPLEVIRAQARRLVSTLFETEQEVRFEAEPAELGQRVRLETPRAVYEELHLPLEGAFQLENMAVAVRASEVASMAGLEVSKEAVANGVSSTVWKARLERVAGRPDILIDSAHNPLGSRALASYLGENPCENRVLLFAVMEDKKHVEIMEPLLPYCRALVATRPPNRRAEAPELLAGSALERGLHAEAVEPTDRALGRARQLAGEEGEVVVAGSTFLAGEVKRLLEIEVSAGL